MATCSGSNGVQGGQHGDKGVGGGAKGKGDIRGQKRRYQERKRLAKKMKMAAMSGNQYPRCDFFII